MPTPQWALDKIEIAKTTGSKKLALWGSTQSKLTTFPHEILSLTSLETLNLSWNQLTRLPEGIGQLINLISLDLRGNELNDLPECIGQLTHLTYLNLMGSKLTHLPESLGQLTNLTHLDLSINQLTHLPESIGQLTNLIFIKLNYNKLTHLPESIGQLTNLTKLNLYDNELTILSSEIAQLRQLQKLYLSNNPLTTPPLEVLDIQSGLANLEKIRAYFRQQEEAGITYLYEAKLLIIGEGGVGKTTLAHKLVDPNCELPQEDDTTRGIEVGRWEFDYKPKELDAEVKFRVNIWDFGGQEIYHATHQFFLTKRAVYVLVDDTREFKTDFYYWLNVAELFSDNSPLLIVQNEKQDRRRDLPERELRGQFTHFKELCLTNLATGRGLPDLQAKLQHYLRHLPHVGAALPKTWVRVRESMENDPCNYISLEDYLTLCDQHGFKRREDKLQLSDYLHDLGVCLHFQNDPLLKQTVILKPKWGTDAVYKVLDTPAVQQNLGRFTWAQVAEIWDAPEYVAKQAELLQLMLNFKLCYPLREVPQTYISPQLLGEAHGDYGWNEQDNLQLRYKYDFLPKGLLARFIVECHTWIENQAWVWKSGVILAKDNSRAEVIEYYGKREIQIRVLGKNKKDLLTVVAHELDKIHASYSRLRYDKLIPCNCRDCYATAEPHFYPFEVLRRFRNDGKLEIQCQKNYHMVNVLQLLDDVANKSSFSGRFEINISRSDKQALIDAFATCPTLSNLETRDLIVSALSFGAIIQRNPATKLHITYMVNASLNYPNGMDELLELVQFYEQDSLPMRAVLALWESR